MNDRQSSRSTASQGLPARRELPVDEDEQPLGWECANPVLQIERWLQDIGATPPLVSSKS